MDGLAENWTRGADKQRTNSDDNQPDKNSSKTQSEQHLQMNSIENQWQKEATGVKRLVKLSSGLRDKRNSPHSGCTVSSPFFRPFLLPISLQSSISGHLLVIASGLHARMVCVSA